MSKGKKKSEDLRSKQTLKVKLAVCQRAMPEVPCLFLTIFAVIIHSFTTALVGLRFFVSAPALPLISLTYKQMEMSRSLAFFPYNFVSLSCQAN